MEVHGEISENLEHVKRLKVAMPQSAMTENRLNRDVGSRRARQQQH